MLEPKRNVRRIQFNWTVPLLPRCSYWETAIIVPVKTRCHIKACVFGAPATGVPSLFSSRADNRIERPDRLIRHQFGRIHQQRQGVGIFTVRTEWGIVLDAVSKDLSSVFPQRQNQSIVDETSSSLHFFP